MSAMPNPTQAVYPLAEPSQNDSSTVPPTQLIPGGKVNQKASFFLILHLQVKVTCNTLVTSY